MDGSYNQNNNPVTERVLIRFVKLGRGVSHSPDTTPFPSDSHPRLDRGDVFLLTPTDATNRMQRRKYLGTISATVSGVALAGCSGDSGEGSDSTTDAPIGEGSDSTTDAPITPSEEWQRNLTRCSDSDARIAVRDVRVEADGSTYVNDGNVLVVIENLDIVSWNIVDITVTYRPYILPENEDPDDPSSVRRYWGKEERTLDGEDLQSYTIDASYSDGGAFGDSTYGIGSKGEVLDVNVFTADNPDGGGSRLCWKPTES